MTTLAPAIVSSVDVFSNEDRRRRPRLSSATNGWVFLGDDDHAAGHEIAVTDLTRLGVGFASPIELAIGSICKLRVGFDPRRLARRFKVTWCRENATKTFQCGGEFV